MGSTTLALVVSERSSQLDRLFQSAGDDALLLDNLPLAFVRGPAATNLPKEIAGIERIQRVARGTLRLLLAIDYLLGEARCVARKYAVNGHRWACHWVGGVGIPRYPVLNPPGSGIWQPMASVDASLPTKLAHPAVLNLSMQFGYSAQFDSTDVLHVATRQAAQAMPVVVAAGNHSRQRGLDTMSVLARAPWVISVGATDSDLGGNLLELSSGGSDEIPGTGPTVVAYGEDAFAPGHWGTSFAAPRVSLQIVALTGFILALREATTRLRDESPEGIPLLARFYADWGFKGLAERQCDLPALPSGGIKGDTLQRTLSLLREAGDVASISPTPDRILTMLLRSAKPLPDYGPHEVGAGFVGEDTTKSYLRRFTGLEFARIFASPRIASGSFPASELQELYLANLGELEDLFRIWPGSSLSWAWDLSDGRRLATSSCPYLDPDDPTSWETAHHPMDR